MNTFLIIFDPDLIGQLSGDSVENTIKSLGGWAKLSNNVWLVKSYSNAPAIRDSLKIIAPSSKITVFDVTNSGWATSNIIPEVVNWLKINI